MFPSYLNGGEGLNERKIWTDIGISMNLKKKKMGFGANGGFALQKKREYS